MGEMKMKTRNEHHRDRAETIIYAAVLTGLLLIIAIAASTTADSTGISVSTQIHAALTTSDIATDAEIRAANGTGPGGMEP